MEFYQTKIRPWIGILALLFIGGFMISQPHLFDHVDPSGRKAFTKLIFSYIWGIPVGIIALLVGIFMGFRQLKK